MIVLRSFLAAAVYPFCVGFWGSLMVIGVLVGGKSKFQDWVLENWANQSLWLFGVKVKAYGLDKLPKSGFLLLFNHTSLFDILVIQLLIPRIRFGSKIELFKIPIFGAAMRAAGVLPIARHKREEVFKVYQEAEERARAGQVFALAPEGTRQKTETLAPFKAGPFIFALNSGIPIVPVILKGASKVLPKGSLLPNAQAWSSEIEAHFGDPIEVKGLKLEDRQSLQALLFEKMSALQKASQSHL